MIKLLKVNKSFLTFVLFLLLFGFSRTTCFAQVHPNYNIAITHPQVEKEASGSDIMTLTVNEENNQEILIRSTTAYDEKMFGVLVSIPALVIRTNTNIPLARAGNALVSVTDINGPISVGDYVTSSPIPGKGQRASELTGYILGVALENFDGKSGIEVEHEGKKYNMTAIKVEVGIGPASPILIKASGGLFGTLKQLFSSLMFNIRTSKQIEKIIRYIIAALIAIITMYINYKTFGRNVTKGIEAIGRNPLAKVSIQTMIVVNVILIATVSIGGIILSLAVLTI